MHGFNAVFNLRAKCNFASVMMSHFSHILTKERNGYMLFNLFIFSAKRKEDITEQWTPLFTSAINIIIQKNKVDIERRIETLEVKQINY